MYFILLISNKLTGPYIYIKWKYNDCFQHITTSLSSDCTSLLQTLKTTDSLGCENGQVSMSVCRQHNLHTKELFTSSKALQ